MRKAALFILLFTSLFILPLNAEEPMVQSEVKINLALSGLDEVEFGFSDDPDILDKDEINSIPYVSLETIATNSDSIIAGSNLYIYYRIQSDKSFKITLESAPLSALKKEEGEIKWWSLIHDHEIDGTTTFEHEFFGGDDYAPKLIYEHNPGIAIGSEGIIPITIRTEDLTYVPVTSYSTEIILTLSVEGGNV